jgi:hypothetical protein
MTESIKYVQQHHHSDKNLQPGTVLAQLHCPSDSDRWISSMLIYRDWGSDIELLSLGLVPVEDGAAGLRSLIAMGWLLLRVRLATSSWSASWRASWASSWTGGGAFSSWCSCWAIRRSYGQLIVIVCLSVYLSVNWKIWRFNIKKTLLHYY